MTRFIERSRDARTAFGLVGALAVLVLLSSLVGCGSSAISDALPDQRLVYKKQREAAENLEIPPDLTAGTFDDAMDIPDGGGEPTTFSEYAGGRAQRRQTAATGAVLPAVPNVDLKRSGEDRWLEVQASPQQVWPRIIAFWRQQGILLVEQEPAVGVMRTDWLDNRAEIRKDFVTRMVSKVAEGLYATSTRDQYTVRIEDGLRTRTTEIHLTHRGMEEKLASNTLGDSNRTVWQPSGSDPAKEAEMLRRLMVYLGVSQQRAVASTAPASAAARGPRSRLVSEGGVQFILIPEELRRAWRLTGSALDRAGFAVEDRDQSRGIYYVRYAGEGRPGRGRGPGRPPPRDEDRPGLMSRLAFWRKKDIDRVKQYQIRVAGNATESRVSVLDSAGRPDQSESGHRILALLQEQMR